LFDRSFVRLFQTRLKQEKQDAAKASAVKAAALNAARQEVKRRKEELGVLGAQVEEQKILVGIWCAENATALHSTLVQW
jgi:hypothetical protein